MLTRIGINLYFAGTEQRNGFERCAGGIEVRGCEIVTVEFFVSFYGQPHRVNLLFVKFSILHLSTTMDEAKVSVMISDSNKELMS